MASRNQPTKTRSDLIAHSSLSPHRAWQIAQEEALERTAADEAWAVNVALRELGVPRDVRGRRLA